MSSVCLACSTGAGSPDRIVKEVGPMPLRAVEPPAEREPDLDQARFFARLPGSAVEDELELTSFRLAVDASGATARSRIVVSARNPAERDREAVLRIPIPPGAAVTDAILYVGDRPMRGSIVERDRARQIYDSIVSRRRDPLLAVWGGREWIDVVIFPVPARGERKFELEWVEALGADADGRLLYRLPILAHRGQIVGGPDDGEINRGTVDLRGRRWLALGGARPRAVAGRAPGDPFRYVLSAGVASDAPAGRVIVIAETSAAMSREDRLRQREQLDALLAGAPPDTSVTLLAADWLVESVAENVGPDEARQALDGLDAIPSAGALDLEGALAAAIDRAEGAWARGRALPGRDASSIDRADGAGAVIYLGRGFDRFRGDAVEGALTRLRDRRLALVVIGPGAVAQPLADAAWLSGGRVVSTDRPEFAELLRGLGSAPPRAGDTVESWFPLETVTGEVVWLGRASGRAPSGRLGHTAAARNGAGAGRDLPALWARARIPAMRHGDEQVAAESRVLTPFASLLVLETEADYARFGIERSDGEEAARGYEFQRSAASQPGAASQPNAAPQGAFAPDAEQARNSGVLGVLRTQQGGSLATMGSSDFSSGLGDRDVYGGLIGNEIGEMQGGWGAGGGGTGLNTIGSGSYGTIGHGSGTGRGYGVGHAVPQARIGAATVTGNLDKNVIRRHIRQKLSMIQYCYEKQLLVEPSLAGTLTVSFTIDRLGRVIVATGKGMRDTVVSCVVSVIKGIQFPAPEVGTVEVAYPFAFAAPPIPKTKWEEALEETSIAAMADAVGAPSTDRADVLAWWLVDTLHRREETLHAYLLAARLLDEAGSGRDARRVLSEAAPRYPTPVEAELRRRQLDADADRVAALARR